MSDEQINVKSWEVRGYEPQGSIEIAAPEALPAVVAERKGRKNRPPSFCRLRRQTAPVLYVKRGKRDGKRDYKLFTETGEVQWRFGTPCSSQPSPLSVRPLALLSYSVPLSSRVA
jgi:hypothetical protein